MRSNVKHDFPETYYRRSFLKTQTHFAVISNTNAAWKSSSEEDEKSLSVLCDIYESDISSSSFSANADIAFWYLKLSNGHGCNPKNAIDAFLQCEGHLYSTILKLLKILVALPVTKCTPEWSFSTLRILKTYLRNSTSEERQKRD
ncbi:hypothetical protein PR048_023380 [Dryococelus australis]|uniref:HAT C-terminal dimerisation domain-containing protein n=1 Tax=Dryococelus australis TaxID=614101 RepID=A0ABQ9GTX2_9NEOP|nr:hypothetical protein PR048_023380 [Dryococelus australis]